MFDVRRELESFIDSIFVVIPPLPENKELYYRVLGDALQRHQELVDGGKDSLGALEEVMEELMVNEALNEAIPLEDGQLWTKSEARTNARRSQMIRRVSLVMFVLGGLVFIFGLLFGGDTPKHVWLIITACLWLLPIIVLLVQRAIYGEESQQ